MRCWVIIILSVCLQHSFLQAQWQLFNSLHPTDDLIVGVHIDDAAGQVVPGDGSVDVTSLVQTAITNLLDAGGGILYIPAGRYRIEGSLEIPESVCLRGDFSIPGTQDIQMNTIFEIYGGKGNPGGLPAILLRGSSSLDGFVIWYPEQTAESITPYPPSVYIQTNGGKLKHCASVKNVFLVNSYTGIRIGPENLALPIVRNIYGSPLKLGIFLDNCTDISRIYDIYFDPDYWVYSGLNGAPSTEGPHKQFIYENATGFEIYKTDNGFQGFWNIKGFHTGILFAESETNGGSAGGLAYNVNISDGKYGIRVRSTHMGSLNISASYISGDSAGILAEKHTGRIQFNSSIIDGGYYSIIAIDDGTPPNSYFSFQDCEFTAPVHFSGQYISIIDSKFSFSGNHLTLTGKCKNAIILDNTFDGIQNIINNATEGTIIAHNNHIYEKAPGFSYRANFKFQPSKSSLYLATNYAGVIPDDQNDDAGGIQQAIDNAFNQGGGIVFLPPGKYILNHPIAIKQGVELRGSLNFPHHTGMLSVKSGQGSLIYVNQSKGIETGATITLEPGSGIRGLAFHYPEQTFSAGKPVKYPWLLGFTGGNIYAINIFASNPYQYIDLYSYRCDNHYLENVMGIPLNKGIVIGNGSSGGILRNVHFNGTFWGQTAFPNESTGLEDWNLKNSDGFILGQVQNQELFQCFTITVHRGLVLYNDESGPNGVAVNFGVDNSETALTALANNDFGFINTSLINKEYAETGRIIHLPSSMKDSLVINNIRVLGFPSFLVDQDDPDSKLIMNQAFFQSSDNNQQILVNNGSLEIINAVYRYSATINSKNSNIPVFIYGNFFREGLTYAGPDSLITGQYYLYPHESPPEKKLIYCCSLPDKSLIISGNIPEKTPETGPFRIWSFKNHLLAEYQLGKTCNVRFVLYDLLGRQLYTEDNHYEDAGINLKTIELHYPYHGGMYILQMIINNREVRSGKIILD
jgi:hypothetical protein